MESRSSPDPQGWSPEPGGSSPEPPESSRSSADRAAAIDDVVEALEPRLRRGRVTLLADVPGTVEVPALVEALARRARAEGHEVVVALELPLTEAERLATGERATIAAGPFWRRPPTYDDGRSSVAVLELVVSLVELGVTVVAADGPWAGPGAALDLSTLDQLEVDRDETMAGRILAAPSRAVTIVLLGLDHVRLVGSTAATRLARWEPGLVSLAPVWCGGARFGLPDIGAEVGLIPLPDSGDDTPGAWWAAEPGPDGLHGTYAVGPFTPSPSPSVGDGPG